MKFRIDTKKFWSSITKDWWRVEIIWPCFLVNWVPRPLDLNQLQGGLWWNLPILNMNCYSSTCIFKYHYHFDSMNFHARTDTSETQNGDRHIRLLYVDRRLSLDDVPPWIEWSKNIAKLSKLHAMLMNLYVILLQRVVNQFLKFQKYWMIIVEIKVTWKLHARKSHMVDIRDY